MNTHETHSSVAAVRAVVADMLSAEDLEGGAWRDGYRTALADVLAVIDAAVLVSRRSPCCDAALLVSDVHGDAVCSECFAEVDLDAHRGIDADEIDEAVQWNADRHVWTFREGGAVLTADECESLGLDASGRVTP